MPYGCWREACRVPYAGIGGTTWGVTLKQRYSAASRSSDTGRSTRKTRRGLHLRIPHSRGFGGGAATHHSVDAAPHCALRKQKPDCPRCHAWPRAQTGVRSTAEKSPKRGPGEVPIEWVFGVCLRSRAHRPEESTARRLAVDNAGGCSWLPGAAMRRWRWADGPGARGRVGLEEVERRARRLSIVLI